MNIGRCSGCGQPIIWIVTTNGKKMPCDPDAHMAFKGTTGNKDKIVTGTGVVVSCDLSQCGGVLAGVGYTPHWATCPAAQNFKKGKSK